MEESLKKTTLIKVSKLKELLPAQLNKIRQVKLPRGCEFVYINYNKVHKTIGIESYFQCFEPSVRNNALIGLFTEIINEPTFDVLRTKEQLGYIVFNGIRIFSGILGVKFTLQSDKLPHYLDLRIENFIHVLAELLDKMTDEQFNNHVKSLSVKKLQEDKTISSQANTYWVLRLIFFLN